MQWGRGGPLQDPPACPKAPQTPPPTCPEPEPPMVGCLAPKVCACLLVRSFLASTAA